MSKVSFNPSIVMKGLQELNKTKESGNIGNRIEEVLKIEDEVVEGLVAHKDELALPENRAAIKENIEYLKSSMKVLFRTSTDKDLPKTIREFTEMAVEGIIEGMMIGNVNAALALIPEATATTERSASVKTASLETSEAKDNNIEDRIDEVFLTSDRFAHFAAENREKLTNPSYRKNTLDQWSSMKGLEKQRVSSVTEETLPKTIKEAFDVFFQAFDFGSYTGVIKMALALIPEKSS